MLKLGVAIRSSLHLPSTTIIKRGETNRYPDIRVVISPLERPDFDA